jgi:CRP-like cAMP-binding protein
VVEFRVLHGVPAEDVRELLAIARRRTFKRDEVVFHQGDPADSLHLIVKGRFAVRITTPMGHVAMLAVRGPGDAFGELALLSEGSQRSANVSALEPSETFSVLRREFWRLAGHHPMIKDLLLALLAEQIRRANERAVVAHYLDSEMRVRWSLTQLAPVYAGDAEILVSLTQEQLAELAGTARATVNRVLREEQERGTVRLERGRVRILLLDEIARRVRDVPSF